MCPDLNLLAALAEGEAIPEAAAHVDVCGACREEVEALRALAGLAGRESASSLALWKTLAREAGSGDRGKAGMASPLRMRWAAAILLAVGAGAVALRRLPDGLLGLPDGTVDAKGAAAALAGRPAWLMEEGAEWASAPGSAPRTFVLSGAVTGVAGAGARARAEGSGLRLLAGDLCLSIPEGISCRILGPAAEQAEQGCAEVEASGAEVWAGWEEPAPLPMKAAWGLLLPAARAEEGVFRVWLASGRAVLRAPGAGPQEIAAPALAEFRHRRWEIARDPGGCPARLKELRRAPTRPAGREWPVAAHACRRAEGGWRLGPDGPARLADPSGPEEGILLARFRRPPQQVQVTLAFPQPGGSRAWLLGDWVSRGFGETVTLSVAYGPWGAEGYVDGRRAWSMDASRLAQTLSASGLATGIEISGGAVEIEEARILWAP